MESPYFQTITCKKQGFIGTKIKPHISHLFISSPSRPYALSSLAARHPPILHDPFPASFRPDRVAREPIFIRAESLFHHSLTCSSTHGSPLLDLGFLDNLRYPKSLKTEDVTSSGKRPASIISSAW
ncbi:hypothetical protein KSP40_PGU019303 [Platanthera guangdongensis]|uniref:Uncharacterized protein n=1 Tax=Platanthera guangdongensis TaxID=2320717 RepID=A0ABR2N1R4_9ASPA